MLEKLKSNFLLCALTALSIQGCYEDNYGNKNSTGPGTGPGTENPTNPGDSKKIYRYAYLESFYLSETAILDVNCGVSTGLELYRSTEIAARVAALKSSIAALADTVETVDQQISETDCGVFAVIEQAAGSFSASASLPDPSAEETRPALHFRNVFVSREVGTTAPSSAVTAKHWAAWQFLEDQGEYVVSKTYLNFTPSYTGFLSNWLSTGSTISMLSGNPIISVDPSPAGTAKKKQQIQTDTQTVLTWLGRLP